MGLLVEDKFGRKVLIIEISGIFISGIGSKPSSQSSILCSGTFDDLIHGIRRVFIPGDILLSRQMDLQMIDRWP